MKKTLAIFDLTDCEGCETQILSFHDSSDYSYLLKYYDITSWRLASGETSKDDFDIALIEGNPVTKKEIEALKILREKSKIIIAMGACACIGGIPGLVNRDNREKLIHYVYGAKYKAKAINTKPIDHFISVDYYLPGCPVNPDEVKEILANLANNRILKEKSATVCFTCKTKHNDCLFLQGEPCLGSITKDGCGAICPSNGLKCYGCWGQAPGANFEGMIIALKRQGKTKTQIKKILDIFLKNSSEYKKYLEKPKKIKIKIKL